MADDMQHDDQLAIIRVITDMATLSDRREWEGATALFTDPVSADYTALAGGEPTTGPPAELVSGWKQALSQYTATQHMLSNQRVDVDGDSAEAQAYFQATHCKSDGTLWVLGGAYQYQLRRMEGGWRIASLTMTPLWSHEASNTL